MNNQRSIKRVKLILPALTEATSPYWRPIKYSLFPPLGLATLAAYLDPNLEICLQDEHVEKLNLDDDPDLAIIQVYITTAYRAYAIADRYRAAVRITARSVTRTLFSPAGAATTRRWLTTRSQRFPACPGDTFTFLMIISWAMSALLVNCFAECAA